MKCVYRPIGFLPLMLLCACPSDEIASAGEIGWSFSYRDWTKAACDADGKPSGCTVAQMRACSNDSTSGFKAIDKVRVFAQDIDDGLAPFDVEFNCDDGTGAKRVPLRGIGARVYRLLLEAKAADGTVLYRHRDENYDLLRPRSDVFELQAATGEWRFTPAYSGLGDFACPTSTVLDYQILSSPGDTLLASGSAPVCAANLRAPVVIRHVPVEPKPSAAGFSVDRHILQLEAKSGAVVDYCHRDEWHIFPAAPIDNIINPSLSVGPCP